LQTQIKHKILAKNLIFKTEDKLPAGMLKEKNMKKKIFFAS
jgi:hypothetical protein